MATTQNTYTGNGSLTNYSFTFPYLEESDVKVSLDGVDQATTAYSFANATTISFNTAPGNNVAIRIYRETDTDSARTTFFAGSAIRAQDLNDNNNQLLYSTQETINRRLDRTGGTMTGDLVMDDSDIVFEGATDDAFETTLSVVDPTADRTINLPNQSGTVPVLAAESATQITSTPEELNLLDGSTAGTVTASNAVVVDSNKDVTGFRNVTLTGELAAATLDVSGNIDVDGTANLDEVDIDGAVDIAGEVAMNSNKITGLGTPTANSDAATKAYVDGVALAAIPDGDKGDITVSSSGATWTIDDTAVTAGSYTFANITVNSQGRLTAASSGTISSDAITEGNTEAEVVDTGTDGHFKVTTEGTERVRIGPSGQIGIAGANYGTSGQVLTSGGPSGAISWADAATGYPEVGSGGTNRWAVVHSSTVDANYSIPSGSHVINAGPMTVNSGVTVTIPSGSNWTIV